MAVDTFIPEVWAAQLLTELRKAHVFTQGGVINRNYEGEIANYGDTVHINSLSALAVRNYVKNVTNITVDDLTTVDQTLLIDQAKYFAFQVDDVDQRQVRDNGELLNEAASDAAYRLADTADLFIANLMATNAGNVEPVTTVTVNPQDPYATGTTANGGAYEVLLRLKLRLDKSKVPTAGRFAIVSPDFHAALLSDARFTDVSKYSSNTPIMNGEVGRALGFNIMVSLNLPVGTAAPAPTAGQITSSNFVVAGHSMATTYAEQINKVEAYRQEARFNDAIKGLHLYGAKVIRPEALAVCDVDVVIN